MWIKGLFIISDFRERLIQFYTSKKNTVSVSPLREGRDKPICDVFVQPKLSHVIIEKDGSRKKTENYVHQYKDLFNKDGKLNNRVFVQGEPGMGKTTFLTEVALDWCDAVSVHNPDHKPIFCDVNTLKEFQFLFQISLRDATDQREVIEMIKTQIVHEIYTDAKREETVKLLPQILARETCLVTMDGLNEWVDRLNKCVIPLLAQCYTKCISVITSRPWKMADERIKDSQINTLIEIEGVIEPEELSKKIINSLQTCNEKTHTEFMTYVNERQLSHFFTSPLRLTLLVNVWMNYKISGSLCEIHCILIDVLFKNANARKGYFQKGGSFQCLSNTRFIQQQIDIFDALAKAAFYLTFSGNKSLVFTERELLNYISDVQLEFCLRAGVLTKRYSSSKVDQDAQFSFIHETVQDFMAAYHIANSNQDCIAYIQMESKYNVLEMGETIIYLCGLECRKANQLLNRLADDKFLNDINQGLSVYVKGICCDEIRAFCSKMFIFTERNILRPDIYENDYNLRCLTQSVLFQRMLIAGYTEAKASGEKDICLTCSDFIFGEYLNESGLNTLKNICLSNKSDVQSFILERNDLFTSEILTVIQQSKHSLRRVMMAVTPEINNALYHSSIQELHYMGNIDVSAYSYVFPSLSQLTFLGIVDTTFLEDIVLPGTIEQIALRNCTFSAVFLRRLLVRLSSLKHKIILYLVNMNVTDSNTNLFQPELLSSDMKNISLFVTPGNSDMYKLIRSTSIGSLYLWSSDDVSLASDILHTLNKLTVLYLHGANMGRCDIRLPASLQFIILCEVECTFEWLCSLLITLSSLDHPVNCLLDVVIEAPGDDYNMHLSDLRSEFVSLDLSYIEIGLHNDRMDLLEILRDTNIRKLTFIRSSDCALASESLQTLHKLTDLTIHWGCYTGRCNLKLPALLQSVTLFSSECSSEWMCSLLITLSSLDHHVICLLQDVVLQPCEEARGDDYNKHLSDLRSEFVSRDLSNIEIFLINGNMELLEMLRDTNIRKLTITRSSDCALASESLQTLHKLTELTILRGCYTGRCNLKLPALLQSVNLSSSECSSEWMCSLLITLSSLDHPVECLLQDVVLQPCEEARGDDYNKHLSDLRSEFVSSDLSNIEIRIKDGNMELLEILRDTNIRKLTFIRSSDCALASESLQTLHKLTELTILRGSYTGRCNLKLPALLQSVDLSSSECSSEWMCSLLITLSSLDHPVKCLLQNVVLQPCEEARGDDYNKQPSDLRSEFVSSDLSNIEIHIKDGKMELLEILRDTNIRKLRFIRSSDCALASESLPTLHKLTELTILRGCYTGRCNLKLPALLQSVNLSSSECSSEWMWSLLITLSSLDHPVKCLLCDIVLQPCEEARGDDYNKHLSDLRSEFVSSDLSNLEIRIKDDNMELLEILRDTNIRKLTFIRLSDCALASESLQTLHKLTELTILWGSYTGRCNLKLPALLQSVDLSSSECSSEWMCSLLITLSSLDHPVKCLLQNVVLQPCEEARGDDYNKQPSDLRSEFVSSDLSNIEIRIKDGNMELLEILRDTNIRKLTFIRLSDCALASESLQTLHKLTKLTILRGCYTGRCNLKLPALLQSVNLSSSECSSEWMWSLLITLSSLDHPVECLLCDIVLQPCEKARGDDYNKHLSDMRSEFVSRDLSYIEIRLKDDNMELLEILRDTNIRKLTFIRLSDCALASESLQTLHKLTELTILWGCYTGRCNLKLPALLQSVNLFSSECSSEWMCSLLITLSSLDHPVKCLLQDVVLQPCEEARGDDYNKHPSDLRSEFVSSDLSYIEIHIKDGNMELLEILRDTNIRKLTFIRSSDCALASESLQTLHKLTELTILRGCYTGRCNLKLPALLQSVNLSSSECSSEWMWSLLITLSSLDHPVKCQLCDIVLQPCEKARGDDYNKHLSDMRSEFVSRDLSYIEIRLKDGNMELLEILRDTNIRKLTFIRLSDCALASESLQTLHKLTELKILRGSYTGRCNLKLPALLQSVNLYSSECSSEWMCSLLITLSSLDHPVKCLLQDVVLQPCEEARGDDYNKHPSDLRSEFVSSDLSNIEIRIKDGNMELLEILRDTNIRKLTFIRSSDCALASESLQTLHKLTELTILRGCYTGRCNLKLPALFQNVYLRKCECSSEWMCTLLSTLSTLDHPVECWLRDVVLQQCENDSHMHLSDFGSEPPDLSNIKIYVQNGSLELLQILRNTSFESVID
ncbi:hypothetical protein DPMN_156281 [Dreissena polymorpha]|uniref:NACHT domain-containing protein n=1 Tax=Dreissena polymorpha TaxID=45954 RepID=A0A9D4FSV2_DREPO|nr:hypothetical protein DPMN_156281 [Dreissena polymorpha]